MEFYGFNLRETTVIELIYDLQCNFLGYYLQYERDGYPCPVYFKFSKDHSKILEYYPYIFKDIETSIKIFTGEVPYNKSVLGEPFTDSFKYLSFNGKDKPTQIYTCEMSSPIIYRANNDKLDGIYILSYQNEFEEMFQKVNLPDNVKELIKKYNPIYIYLFLDENRVLKKLLIGFHKGHSEYKKIIKDFNIPFFNNFKEK